MPATKKYDAVATIGEYKDRNGETKKRYVNVGTVFENDKGQLSLKLDAVPCAQEWSGWISFFEPKERDQHSRRNPMGGVDRTANEAIGKRDNGGSEPDDGEIPFMRKPAPFQP